MSAVVDIVLVQNDIKVTLSMPCEPINEWLCITPYVGRLVDEDTLRLSGGFNITHIPSGYAACHDYGCIQCARYLGQLLAQLDWPSAPSIVNKRAYTKWLNGHPKALLGKVKQSLNLAFICDAEECDWSGGDEPE